MRRAYRAMFTGAATITVLVLLAAPGQAAAPECRPRSGDTAEDFLKAGQELADGDQFAEALVCYEKSDQLAPSVQASVRRGGCLVVLEHYLEGARRLLGARPQLKNLSDPDEKTRLERITNVALSLAFQNLARVRLSFPDEGEYPTVSIDGEAWRDDHDGEMLVEPGEHLVEEKRRGVLPRRVQMLKGKEVVLLVGIQGPLRLEQSLLSPPAPTRSIHWSTWTLGATGLAGLLTFAITGAVAIGVYTKLEADCPSTPSCTGTAARANLGRTLSQVSAVSAAIGLGGVIGAGVTFKAFGAPGPSASPPPSVSLSLNGVF